MEQTTKKMMIVWNTAVRNVGGMRNTVTNFYNVAQEFINLGKIEGFTKEEMMKEINDNYESTISFMQR